MAHNETNARDARAHSSEPGQATDVGLIGHDPPLTKEEADCLVVLSSQTIWDCGFSSHLVTPWAVERLDRRSWLHAQEIDPTPGDDAERPYSARGPWFYPTRARTNEGRPDWPTIMAAFERAERRPDGARLWARIRVTPEGRAHAESLTIKDVAAPNPFYEVACTLEKVSAEWRNGDAVMRNWLTAGLSPNQTGFELIIGPEDGVRRSVRFLVAQLRTDLIPLIATQLDPALRDELRALVRDLDPCEEGPDRYYDPTLGDEQYGVFQERWRHTWAAMNHEPRIRELVPLLMAFMRPDDATPPEGDHAETRATPPDPVRKPDGWTRGDLLSQANHDGQICGTTTFDNIRKAAGIPAGAKGGGGAQRRYSVPQLRLLIAAAESGTFRQGALIAAAWRKLFAV